MGESGKLNFHVLKRCCDNMMARYSIFGIYVIAI